MHSVVHIARRFRKLGPHDRALVCEAAWRLIRARLALRLFSFARVSQAFGIFVPPTDPRATQHATGTAQDMRLAREIGRAVARAARPLGAVCLPQAMAAQAMLRRRGIASVMHFGVAKAADQPINAHAWLSAVGVEVVGYPVLPDLKAISCFVP